MGEESRRRWSALWGAICGGLFLIVVGYLLLIVFEKYGEFSIEAWEVLAHYWPVFLVLLGVWIIGGGIIRWCLWKD